MSALDELLEKVGKREEVSDELLAEVCDELSEMRHRLGARRMTPLEILKSARARIEKPENWTQGAFARDSRGNASLLGRHGNACSWCALGAILVLFEPNLEMNKEESLAMNALECAVGGSVMRFNDTHTHAEVLAAFDDAIELARKEQT